MNIRKGLGLKGSAGIDITPLVDVVFILLIFLLISTTFKKKEMAFPINLPTATEKTTTVVVERPTVFVTAAGEYYFYVASGDGSRPVDGIHVRSLDELKLRLEELKKRRPDISISVKGDNATTYQHIINVVNQCYQAGIRKVHFPFQQAQ